MLPQHTARSRAKRSTLGVIPLTVPRQRLASAKNNSRSHAATVRQLEQRVAALVAENLALMESEQRSRDLIECSHDWIWEVDRYGVYTCVGAQCRELLGYEPEEIEISGREQQRIGQDLHDELCQLLSGLKFKTTLLEQRLADRSLREAEDAKERSNPGLELHLMNYRARAIGASLAITSNRTGGATVTCRLPLPAPPGKNGLESNS